MLRGGIGGEVRSGHFPGHRRDVNQRALLPLTEVLHGVVASVKRTEQIGLDDLHMVGQRYFFEPADGARSCVIHPYVDMSKLLDRSLRETCYFSLISYVRRHS